MKQICEISAARVESLPSDGACGVLREVSTVLLSRGMAELPLALLWEPIKSAGGAAAVLTVAEALGNRLEQSRCRRVIGRETI